MKKEFKAVQSEVTVKGRTICGYYAIFNVIDSAGDIIMPGAFAKTIKENGPEGKNRIWHLDEHDPKRRVTKPTVLREDEIGLYFEATIPDVPEWANLHKQYELGNLTEHSFKYNVIKADYGKVNGQDVRYLRELQMWEGSSVTWGCQELAKTVGMKSEDEISELKSKVNELEEKYKALLAQQPPTPNQPEALSTDRVKQIFYESLKLN